jgi:hypothetical protein
VDASGSAYVAGVTNSSDFPTTTGAFQTTYGGGSGDVFLTNLNPAGTALVYSTFLGSTGFDESRGVALGPSGSVYVTGQAGSGFPITPGAFQTTTTDGLDAFVAKFATQVAPQIFLEGTGPANNPSVLFLNSIAPTGATAKFRDSSGVNFATGNQWKEIGTWPAAPSLIAGTVTALGDLHVWLGLKNSDDQGTRFDLRAEIFRNGALVSSGETYCIQGITRNANQATEVTVPFLPDPNTQLDGTTDVLSLKVWARIGTNGSGGFCGGHSNAVGLRLYFDSVNRLARFEATVQP